MLDSYRLRCAAEESGAPVITEASCGQAGFPPDHSTGEILEVRWPSGLTADVGVIRRDAIDSRYGGPGTGWGIAVRWSLPDGARRGSLLPVRRDGAPGMEWHWGDAPSDETVRAVAEHLTVPDDHTIAMG